MTPKEEVEQLMSDGVAFATQMLSEHGEFYPFGRTLLYNGEIQLHSASTGSAFPPSRELLDLLIDGFREGAREHKYKAVALIFDVTVVDPHSGQTTDAVQVGLEHSDGYCADVYLPYSLDNGAVRYGETFASRRQGLVYLDAV